MTTSRRTYRLRRIATTIGNLVSAVYEAVPGAGPARVAAAVAVLAGPHLSRRLSRPVRIVA